MIGELRLLTVINNYKQLGDENFKDSNNAEPIANKYSYYVKSHGFDHNISNEYIPAVKGKNEK